MNKIIFPFQETTCKTDTVSIVPVDLATIDSNLLQMLSKQGDYETKIAQQFSQSWYRSGPGPMPTQGGIWVAGSTLVPLGSSPIGNVETIVCQYSKENWINWQNQISLELLITNTSETLSWTAPLNINTNSTTITTHGAGVPANCRITMLMKVGNLTGGLYQPPFISSYDCLVNYS